MEGEREVVALFESFLLIASSISFLICCSILFWLDGVTSCMASAVASVAVSVSSRLNFASINDVTVFTVEYKQPR